MIRSVAGQRAVVAVLIVLQLTIFVLELLIIKRSIRVRRWYTPVRQWYGPILLTLLGVAFATATFSRVDQNIETSGSHCTVDVDADIGGAGVRYGAIAQITVLLLVSVVGSFHYRATGVKELGAGLLLTELSLNIALMVRLGHKSLAPIDAAVGTMILDAQNVAISVALAAKETLAARWQVCITVVVQLFGLASIPVLITKINNDELLTTDCQHLTFFWWAWLGNSIDVSSSRKQTSFWIYFACRCVGFCQSSFHSLVNTWSFDRAEREYPNDPDYIPGLGRIVECVTYPHFSDYGPDRYGNYPATVCLMYGLPGVFGLTSLVAAEKTMRALELKPSAAIDTVGQVIPLVIAGATVARAIWLFLTLLRAEHTKSRGFMWPFYQKLPIPLDIRRSIQPDAPRPSDSSLPLGTILTDHQDPNSKTDPPVLLTDRVWTQTIPDWTDDDWEPDREVTNYFYARNNTWQAFHPSPDYIQHCSSLPGVKTHLGLLKRNVV